VRELALLDANGRAVDQSLRMIGHERECAFDARQRFVEAAELQQYLAVIAVGVGGCIVEFERSTDKPQRAIAIAALLMDDAQEMHRVEMLRRQFQDSGIE